MQKLVKVVHLYPIYFDAARAVSDGRRVAKVLGVNRPILANIAKAVTTLGLPCKVQVSQYLFQCGRRRSGIRKTLPTPVDYKLS